MKVKIDPAKLGIGRLFNHCNEKCCALGAVCRAVGIEDEEMDNYVGLIFLPNDKGATKELPQELGSFFVADTNWDPISPRFNGSTKFTLNDQGRKIAGLNDKRAEGWLDNVAASLAEGGVEVEWGEVIEEESVDAVPAVGEEVVDG